MTTTDLEPLDHSIAKRLLSFGLSTDLTAQICHMTATEVRELTGWSITGTEEEVNELIVGLMKKVLVQAHLDLDMGFADEKQAIFRMVLPAMIRNADADAASGKEMQEAVERIWKSLREGSIEADAH